MASPPGSGPVPLPPRATEPAAREPVASPVATGDLATQAADLLERVVVTVRDKTTRPALTVARGLVFGLIAAFGGMAALVLLAVLLVRLLGLLRGVWIFPEGIWYAHLIVGTVFAVIGLILMAKRKPPVVKEVTS